MARQDRSEQPGVTRRSVLKVGLMGAAGFGAAGLAGGTTLRLLDRAAAPMSRLGQVTPGGLPEIQFDIGDFIGPVETLGGVQFRFGPVFTRFVTGRLSRRPTPDDQEALRDALATIESEYPFSPEGVFVVVSYGRPYFARFPSGLVADHMPRLDGDESRFVLEEAVASPDDITAENPSPRKGRFRVPMRIETNDVLLTIRSDELDRTTDVEDWLSGSGRLAGRRVRSPALDGLLELAPGRIMFVQRGMPRRLADEAGLRYAVRVHPESPMWMGFADQQVSGTGPAQIATFDGNESARLTTVRSGDYFSNGAIQHLSHVILDLDQWYLAVGAPEEPEEEEEEEADDDDDDESFLERVQYMFRSTPPPSEGFEDQFTDGGGPTFLPNAFRGVHDADLSARGIGTPGGERRIGHISGLQRSSRAADGTAMHVRVDGPGYDAMDVPDGSRQPKLQFSVFVPTARFFADMRRNQSSVDLAREHDVTDEERGLERFITPTRRQNFLVPPRRHRAFPLAELASPPARRPPTPRGPGRSRP